MATFTTVTKSGTAETVLWWEAETDSDSVASVIIIGRWVWVDDQSVSEDARAQRRQCGPTTAILLHMQPVTDGETDSR